MAEPTPETIFCEDAWEAWAHYRDVPEVRWAQLTDRQRGAWSLAMKASLDRFAAQRMAEAWQPIETYSPQAHERALIAGQYPNSLWFVEESYWRKDINCFAGRQLDRVKYWMPLPSPPEPDHG